MHDEAISEKLLYLIVEGKAETAFVNTASNSFSKSTGTELFRN
jgi:hypothetical protein